MTYFDRIEELRAFALTCKASIYNEDAMTAIQLAGCTAKKVNEVVDLVNAVIDMMEKVLTESGMLPNEYDATTETLII